MKLKLNKKKLKNLSKDIKSLSEEDIKQVAGGKDLKPPTSPYIKC